MPDANSLSRRTILAAAAGTVATLPLARLAYAAPLDTESIQTDGPFSLPPLPYPPNALEKAIDAQTMSLHHDKHHATYVKNLNEAIKKAPADWQTKPIEEILMNLDKLPADIQEAVRNNGGGHDNHSIFWTIMSPNGGGDPTGRIAEIINADFGGFEAFKAKFDEAGTKRFGSGWVWLVLNEQKKYEIVSRPNQDSPRMERMIPIMGNDVWEHAYYLRYKNVRADYLKAWWNVVDWTSVNKRIAAAEAR
ncbi:superoxide dismutase [bacterium]|nr:MAG: superoxide dismutase [bacterium]